MSTEMNNAMTEHTPSLDITPSTVAAHQASASLDTRPLLLIVDDEPANLSVLREMLKKDYRLIFAKDGRSAVKMTFEQRPALVLLDVMMPDYSGFDVCRLLSKREETKNIPIIFITALADSENEFKGFRSGAVDYLSKPVNALSLKSRVESNLRLVRAEQLAAANAELASSHQKLKDSFEGTVNVLSQVIERFGTHPMGFGDRCAHSARRMAARLGLSEQEQADIGHAALLNRICDVFMEELDAPEGAPQVSFEARQRLALERAALLAEGLLMPIDGLQNASAIIKHKHERHDGKGFPEGLRGKAVPMGSAILSAVKWFHELVETNLHGQVLSRRNALERMRQEVGKRFSLEVFRALEATVLEGESAAPVDFVLRDVHALQEGMVLAKDLRHPKGMLLLAAGRRLSAERVAHIIDYCRRESIHLSLAIDPRSLPQ